MYGELLFDSDLSAGMGAYMLWPAPPHHS